MTTRYGRGKVRSIGAEAQSQRRRQWMGKYSDFPTCAHPQRFDCHLSHCSAHRKSLTSVLESFKTASFRVLATSPGRL